MIKGDFMKQNNKTIVCAGLMLLFLGLFVIGAGAQDVSLPGITGSDEHPNGCVDCHSKSGDNDYRLNTELEHMDGHPDITGIVKTVPDDCLMCHKSGTDAGPMNLITHESHYENPQENHFVSSYGGGCLECHALDTDTWQMSVKSGPKNW
jgi:hypothetical protein